MKSLKDKLEESEALKQAQVKVEDEIVELEGEKKVKISKSKKK